MLCLKNLVHYLKSVTDWLSPNEDHSKFCQLAWSLLNDCYFSKICINVKPDHLAVTVCYMAMETQGISLDLEQHAETVWWKVGLTSISWRSSDVFICETLLFDNSQKLDIRSSTFIPSCAPPTLARFV